MCKPCEQLNVLICVTVSIFSRTAALLLSPCVNLSISAGCQIANQRIVCQFATDRHQYKILNVSPPLFLTSESAIQSKGVQMSSSPPAPSHFATSPGRLVHPDHSAKSPPMPLQTPPPMPTQTHSSSLSEIPRKFVAIVGTPKSPQVHCLSSCMSTGQSDC
jgi:hypothetical protein